MINSDLIIVDCPPPPSPQYIERTKQILSSLALLILYFAENKFITKIFQQAENSETEQKQTSRRVESNSSEVKNT